MAREDRIGPEPGLAGAHDGLRPVHDHELVEDRADVVANRVGGSTTLEQKVALVNFFTIACRQSNCVPILFTVTRSTALDWA